MLTRIKDRITAHGFNDFQISKVTKKEHQLYLVPGGVESEREVDSLHYEVTVYHRQRSETGVFLGAYTFFIKPGEDIDRYLADAQVGAGLVKNRPFGLAGPKPFPAVEMLDPRLRSARKEAGILADMIMSHAASDQVNLSSAEIYLSAADIELSTSTGIEARKEKGRIEVDLTLLSHAHEKDAEMHFNLVRRNFDHLRLVENIERHQEYARDMLRVQIPQNRPATVVFDSNEIYNLFFPLVFHGSARIKDQGISKFQIGAPVTSGPSQGDLFSVLSSGVMPYGLRSDNFDDDGIPGQEHTMIKNGIFQKFMASKQYADYLGMEATGTFKNMILKPSEASRAKNEIDDYYEIIKFSDLSPDPITGDFVSEIRFGYHHRAGEKIPIKGGSVSGNVFHSLAEMIFSRTEVFAGDYLGPENVAIRNLTLAGI
jgi:predicted Zn-dependent protease